VTWLNMRDGSRLPFLHPHEPLTSPTAHAVHDLLPFLSGELSPDPRLLIWYQWLMCSSTWRRLRFPAGLVSVAFSCQPGVGALCSALCSANVLHPMVYR
jgi:hypothetical protein